MHLDGLLPGKKKSILIILIIPGDCKTCIPFAHIQLSFRNKELLFLYYMNTA